mgnify:CR=1 FL=1
MELIPFKNQEQSILINIQKNPQIANEFEDGIYYKINYLFYFIS